MQNIKQFFFLKKKQNGGRCSSAKTGPQIDGCHHCPLCVDLKHKFKAYQQSVNLWSWNDGSVFRLMQISETGGNYIKKNRIFAFFSHKKINNKCKNKAIEKTIRHSVKTYFLSMLSKFHVDTLITAVRRMAAIFKNVFSRKTRLKFCNVFTQMCL